MALPGEWGELHHPAATKCIHLMFWHNLNTHTVYTDLTISVKRFFKIWCSKKRTPDCSEKQSRVLKIKFVKKLS